MVDSSYVERGSAIQTNYGSSADLFRIKHGHDRAGNRLYREEADTSDVDQLYGYDNLNRLTQSEEGTLSAGKDSVSSLNFEQQWALDPTGNWFRFKEDSDGDSTWDLDQSRTSNRGNEITNVTETAGPSWLTPAYNRAGNMTTIPQPGDPTQSYTATYDAWNRLVKLEDGQNTVAEYVFDGAKRLVVRKKYVSGSLNQTRHFYHTAQWQTIEERLESGGQIASTADRQFTWGQRYIDDLVCRTVTSTHDYAYQDANWNVILSSSGLSRVGYEAYGQIRSTCAAAQGDLDDWEHYFAGYRRDEDTGLYLVRHRVYQPELGCWVQRDPIGYRGSEWNLLEYLRSHPMNHVDPSGLAITKQECLDAQSEVLYSLWWRKIWDRKTAKKCPHPLVLCECCDRYAYSKQKGNATTIRLCYNKLSTVPGMWLGALKELMKHELIHAYDNCYGSDSNDCDEVACSEIRAYDYSGNCDSGGMNRGPRQSREDCVKETAKKSTRNIKKCAGYSDAEFDAMWKKCSSSADELPPWPIA
jgi:RHS repeat-associated protein